MVGALISLIRPQQWVKNGFILLPLFFGGKLADLWCWEEAILTFLAFSFMASAVYCLNDIRDINADRLHPLKRKRPLASGELKPAHAVTLMIILIILSLSISYTLLKSGTVAVSAILIFYLILNIGYCFKLKSYPIVDVFIVSFGFVLRLVSGGIACEIWLSPWIVLMTFLLALFLAFAKRRDDVVIFETEKIITRRNVARYNLQFMNQVLGLLGAITIVCYIMYTLSPEVTERNGSPYLYVTSIFVLAAILRYLQVSIVDLKSGSPTKVLLHDRFIQICLIIWILTFVIILYV